MRVTRIFVATPLQAGAEVSLPASGAHHVARVLRLRAGAALVVFDGRGGEYQAEITRVSSGEVTVRIGESSAGVAEPRLRITLVQGVSRGERMDWTLQKATELGVAHIAPVLTSRSVVRLDAQQAKKKQEHWQNVVIGACEQSGRSGVPAVATPRSLRDYLANSSGGGLRLLLSPNAPTALAAMTNPSETVELLIGPEGGLDEDETAMAQQAGFAPVRLGPRVLRTETAAVVAMAVMQARWGDLS